MNISVGTMVSNPPLPAAYVGTGDGNVSVVPPWLNNGDNAWQMTAATLVGMQSVPGLVILYGSMVKKKWAVNSAMMVMYAYAMALVCWVGWAFNMSFGENMMNKAGLVGKPMPAIATNTLLLQANITAIPQTAFFPQATLVYFQFVFAAIAVILVGGAVLARMSFAAWALFVPLWITFSYTVGAFSLWGGGFLYQFQVLDYTGGYVIHLSSGVAGFTAAYWVGPRLKADRDRFPPNNIILMLAGAGLLWAGWAGFNGGGPNAANIDASLAVLNTNVAAAASLLVWCCLDAIFSGKPSAVGAVQGLVTGLVAITPGAGIVQTWAAVIMGVCSGSVPWFTMNVLHSRLPLVRSVDDVMGVFHTHAVAGALGGLLTGFFAHPTLVHLFYGSANYPGGMLYKGSSDQVGRQLLGALFIIAWNVVVTTLLLLAIRLVLPLRMSDDILQVGDDAVHGEEAFSLCWDDTLGTPDAQVDPKLV